MGGSRDERNELVPQRSWLDIHTQCVLHPISIYNNIHYMYIQFLFTLLLDFQIDFLSWCTSTKKKIDRDIK